RWDGVAAIKFVSDDETNWLELESGIQVRFASDGTYRTGQFWQIPARTATAQSPSGQIEGPQDNQGDPVALPPQGIKHQFCRLGIVSVKSDGSLEFTDCRCLYPVLTDPQLELLGGDGQEVMPDLTQPANLVSLPQPIAVYVRNLQCAETGAKLRFKV